MNTDWRTDAMLWRLVAHPQVGDTEQLILMLTGGRKLLGGLDSLAGACPCRVDFAPTPLLMPQVSSSAAPPTLVRPAL